MLPTTGVLLSQGKQAKFLSRRPGGYHDGLECELANYALPLLQAGNEVHPFNPKTRKDAS
jgi:hypothetical protein